ncbi:MAG: glycerol-3-phosphate dehydrogenase/oxidase [Caulobacteraceae bacterium]|nr:glycerol-3-phosphate dehydrogenase/oxidase [Caulobacteraceae bacterium]
MNGASESLDLRDRNAVFAALEATTFDVAVIGGGITGAGVARDCAMRGLSVALVEARDFGSGTSSRSSKMIHGGLRYLAQGDLGLVREAASERKAVQAIAPHLAREILFVIPARTAATIAKLRAGLWTFEKLGGVPKSRAHELWSRAELAAKEPALRVDDLSGAVAYPEYLTDDARLTLANVRSAHAHGATVANYARVERILTEGGGLAHRLDVVEALPAAGDRRADVRARVIVNAAGPWVDAVRALEDSAAPKRLALARGIHLVVRHDRLPVAHTIVTPASDRRSVYAVPRGEVTYIGTTDTFHPQAETWPPVTGEDAEYLFGAMAARIAGPRLSASDIVSAWSGVRPLVAQEGKSASDISRKDEVWTGPEGVVSIAGGKLTAYRRMAERVSDMVEERLGRRPSTCRTEAEPLPGGQVDPPSMRRELEALGAAPAEAERLTGLYGAEALEVGVAGPAAEAARAVLHEGALTLEDYWLRRSVRGLFTPDGGQAALEPAARAMAPLLGWSEQRIGEEVAACRAIRTHDMAPFAAKAIA